ncbi:hypothetical protein I552_8531 [Mycobacterium xenopi 3993]|nr:hypothetical protein I552_8531 [Mycobacterium xenopi 3993]
MTNIRLVAAAVSDRDGELPLFVGSAYDSGLTTTVAVSAATSASASRSGCERRCSVLW